jgi:p-hydroxybenzoate 3-monooxygenase
MKTQVCIIGGGPSGLMLSQLLHLKGIETVVLERQTRDYVLSRIRAGVLEHGFAKLMREAECGERMDREGEIHEGFFVARGEQMQRVDLHAHTGNSVMVYGQTELTRDLYEARDRMKGIVIHQAEDVQPHDLTTDKPYVTFRHNGVDERIDCEYVIGADGFHGVSRRCIPKDVLHVLPADRAVPTHPSRILRAGGVATAIRIPTCRRRLLRRCRRGTNDRPIRSV